ncbi:hypothetical protein NP233_g4815 [Leucocoprinus birnbaumii]|uniref:Uncharacterized protein n=1 Tax=Leucocoprinus birnbaumii TaxID=56174 RepID=A0AAD5YRI1_9AGAR|nr:hypothetical protein NP233_g4815 [Leucocoprinus birnbaumii]
MKVSEAIANDQSIHVSLSVDEKESRATPAQPVNPLGPSWVPERTSASVILRGNRLHSRQPRFLQEPILEFFGSSFSHSQERDRGLCKPCTFSLNFPYPRIEDASVPSASCLMGKKAVHPNTGAACLLVCNSPPPSIFQLAVLDFGLTIPTSWFSCQVFLRESETLRDVKEAAEVAGEEVEEVAGVEGVLLAAVEVVEEAQALGGQAPFPQVELRGHLPVLRLAVVLELQSRKDSCLPVDLKAAEREIRAYGSGYPGSSAVGVAGLGFPFFYWPVIFGSTAIIGTGSYLHTHGEYGDVNNSSRPGGALLTATFPSNTNGNTTFRIMADNSTVTSLTADILSSCGSSISNSTSHTSTPYNETGPPIPAQAIQYYRASSIVLSLDSYNNTAVYSNDTNAPPSPLPNNIDTTLLRCLNSTIGNSAPLVDGALDLRWSSPSGIGLFAIVWVVSRLMFQV